MATMTGFHCSCDKGYMVYTPKKLYGEFLGISQDELQRMDEEDEKTGEIDGARSVAAKLGFEFIDGRKTSVVVCVDCGETRDVLKDFIEQIQANRPSFH